jgi:microcystin-dependent protein
MVMKGENNSQLTLSLPKGDGAVSGIGETFQPNVFPGTASQSMPISVSSCRGFESYLWHRLQPCHSHYFPQDTTSDTSIKDNGKSKWKEAPAENRTEYKIANSTPATLGNLANENKTSTGQSRPHPMAAFSRYSIIKATSQTYGERA